MKDRVDLDGWLYTEINGWPVCQQWATHLVTRVGVRLTTFQPLSPTS